MNGHMTDFGWGQFLSHAPAANNPAILGDGGSSGRTDAAARPQNELLAGTRATRAEKEQLQLALFGSIENYNSLISDEGWTVGENTLHLGQSAKSLTYQQLKDYSTEWCFLKDSVNENKFYLVTPRTIEMLEANEASAFTPEHVFRGQAALDLLSSPENEEVEQANQAQISQDRERVLGQHAVYGS